MKCIPLWIAGALSLSIAAPSLAADDSIVGLPKFSCDESAPGRCDCRGYIDCQNLLNNGACKDGQGATQICCTSGWEHCTCRKGGGGSTVCPAGMKPFVPQGNKLPRATPSTSGAESTDTGSPPSGESPTRPTPTLPVPGRSGQGSR